MSYSVFDTSFASNNSEILRWASVGVAAFLTVVVLVWGAMVYTKDTFKSDVEAMVLRDADAEDSVTKVDTMMRRLVIAMFFLATVASTFLSWYVASLHLEKNYLIALDVLNFVSILFLCLGAYMYYKTRRMRSSAVTLAGFAAVMEFVALIILIAAPTAANADGTVTQSALYIPLMIATLAAMAR